VLGITLLAGLIVVVTAGVLQIPFSLFGAMAGGGNSLLPATGGNVAGILISAVGGVVAGAVARPISAGVAVLLYVDLRMRREGLRLARAELSKSIYHPQPSLAQRAVHFVLEWLSRLFRVTQGLPGGWWGFVVLIALAGLLVAVVLARTGPVARARRRRAEPGATSPARTARDHRAA